MGQRKRQMVAGPPKAKVYKTTLADGKEATIVSHIDAPIIGTGKPPAPKQPRPNRSAATRDNRMKVYGRLPEIVIEDPYPICERTYGDGTTQRDY